MKLQAKASLFLSALLLIALLSQGGLFSYFLDNSLRDKASQDLLQEAAQLSSRLDDFILNTQTDILNISQGLNIQALLGGKLGRIETFLQTNFFSNSRFDNGFFILDSQGNLLVDYPVSEIRGKNFAFREYFQRTLAEKKPIISAPYRSKRSGAMVITFTAPLLSYDGKFWGLLAGSINLLRYNFAGNLRDIRIGKTGKIFIYDSQGKILHSSLSDFLVQDGGPSKSDPVLRNLPQGSNGVVDRQAPDGSKFELAFHRLQTTDWMVGILQNEEEILAPLISLQKQTALSLIVALVLALGIGIGGMGILAKPIKALSNSIKEYKGKGWEEPPDLLSRRDEIGALGQRFKNMTQMLNETLTSLSDSETKYRALVQESLVGVFLIQRRRFVFVNPRMAEIFAYSQEEMVSSIDPLDLVAPMDRDRVLQNMSQPLVENHRLVHFFWQGLRKDGSLIEVEVMGSQLVYHGKASIHGTLVDITERRKAETALNQKTETLNFLRTLLEDINRTLDLDQVLNWTIDHILQKTGAEMGSITLLNEPAGVLEFKVRRGYDPKYVEKITTLSIGEGASGMVAETGEPVIITDYASFPRAKREAVELGKIKAMALFPLKITDRLIGILNIASSQPRDFSTEEVDFYQTVAPIIASAINNALIYRHTLTLNKVLEDLSQKDGLTDIFNRRYLEEKLQEEINRCERHGGFLGMLMIDMDEFKKINDTLGHEVGDQVLKKVATLIQDSCRQIDIVGRFGGDEFLVLLFQTPFEEAQRIADRIKRQMKQIEVPGWNRSLSLSIGIASEDKEYRNILRLADDRMYEEKKKHLSA